MYIITMWPS